MRITHLLSVIAISTLSLAPAAQAATAQALSVCSYQGCFASCNYNWGCVSQCIAGLPTCFDDFQGASSEEFTFSDTPDSIAVDSNQDVIVGLDNGDLSYGDGTVIASLAGPIGPIAIDGSDNVFAAVHSTSAGTRGIYKITPAGTATKLVALGLGQTAGGLALFDGDVVITEDDDVLAVSQSGGSFSTLASDALLSGARGIQVYGGDLFAAVDGKVLKITSAGVVSTRSTISADCDDFAFDVQESLYCADESADKVIKVSPTGVETTILDSADGLDAPTAVCFGQGSGNDAERFSIYTSDSDSIVKVELGKVGLDRTGL